MSKVKALWAKVVSFTDSKWAHLVSFAAGFATSTYGLVHVVASWVK